MANPENNKPKEKVINVHPRDVRNWNYNVKPPTQQELIDAFTIYAPRCHHPDKPGMHTTPPDIQEEIKDRLVAKRAADGIEQIEEFLKQPPKL